MFNRWPKTARDLVNALTNTDDGHVLVPALDSREIVPLPDRTHGTAAFHHLTAQITNDPNHPGNANRVRVVRDVLGMADDFAHWWLDQLRQAVGTAQEEAWLTVGATCEVLAGNQVEIPGLVPDHGRKAQLILNTGLTPEPNSLLRRQLMEAVLDGQCSETTSARWEVG